MDILKIASIVIIVSFLKFEPTKSVWKLGIETGANVVGIHFLSRTAKFLPHLA